jgi:hypothetical protein
MGKHDGERIPVEAALKLDEETKAPGAEDGGTISEVDAEVLDFMGDRADEAARGVEEAIQRVKAAERELGLAEEHVKDAEHRVLEVQRVTDEFTESAVRRAGFDPALFKLCERKIVKRILKSITPSGPL